MHDVCNDERYRAARAHAFIKVISLNNAFLQFGEVYTTYKNFQIRVCSAEKEWYCNTVLILKRHGNAAFSPDDDSNYAFIR